MKLKKMLAGARDMDTVEVMAEDTEVMAEDTVVTARVITGENTVNTTYI